MASFADQHAQWQQARADAATSGTAADRAAAEKARQALIVSPAVRHARATTDARPAGDPLGERVKGRRGRS